MSCKHNLKAEGSNAIQGLNPDYSNRTYLHGTAPQSGTRGVINIPSSAFVYICMLVCADNEHLEFIFTAPTLMGCVDYYWGRKNEYDREDSRARGSWQSVKRSTWEVD